MTTSTQTYEIDVADVEYLRHGDIPPVKGNWEAR